MALYNFPNLSSTMMVLPRQTLFRCNNQDFRAQLSRNLQLIDRHTIKIGIGKRLSLSFIDYKKTSPGAGLGLIIDNKSGPDPPLGRYFRSEEHTPELQS